MAKLPTEFGNWTAFYDSVLAAHGHVVAMVHGRVLRHADNGSGICYSRTQKIAQELFMDDGTVRGALGTLVEHGLLFKARVRGKTTLYASKVEILEAWDREHPGTHPVELYGEADNSTPAKNRRSTPAKNGGSTPAKNRSQRELSKEIPERYSVSSSKKRGGNGRERPFLN